MSYHVTGYCAGHLKPEERDRVREAWTVFINALEAATEPSSEQFHGFIAGGDWVGDTQARHDEFKLTADEVRDEKKWGDR